MKSLFRGKKMEKKSSTIDDAIETIAQKIMTEVENASSKDISDVKYAKKILQLSDLRHTKRLLQEIENATSGSVCSIEKKAVIKALLVSTWMQRLYFIIRSFLMTLIGAVITFIYISYFGKIDIYLGFLLGGIIFVASLIITRFFDAQIVKTTKSIVTRLGKHETARDFIMNHF